MRANWLISPIALLVAGAGFGGTITGSGVAFSAVEGAQKNNVLVAHFNDSGALLSNLSATIDWGDNSPGTIGIIVANGGGFDVVGSHTYAEEGGYAPLVTVSDSGVPTTLGGAQASVADAPLSLGSGLLISATEGAAFNGGVASFTDANPGATAADFTATIDWGDNTQSTGTITFSNGAFQVSGSHTFADEGGFTATVTIRDDGGATLTTSDSAAVADARLTAAFSPAVLTQFIPADVVVTTFSDANPSALVSDFGATINWGDGTPPSLGTIVSVGNGDFDVVGQHEYLSVQPYTLNIAIADRGGSSVTTTGTDIVNPIPEPGSFAAAVAGLAMLVGVKLARG